MPFDANDINVCFIVENVYHLFLHNQKKTNNNNNNDSCRFFYKHNEISNTFCLQNRTTKFPSEMWIKWNERCFLNNINIQRLKHKKIAFNKITVWILEKINCNCHCASSHFSHSFTHSSCLLLYKPEYIFISSSHVPGFMIRCGVITNFLHSENVSAMRLSRSYLCGIIINWLLNKTW